MGTFISLCSPNQHVQATVDVEQGGRLASLQIDGRELLVSRHVEPLLWGCYPMVPFAGRIRHGVIDFEGTRATLPTLAGPHAIHGFGFTSPWQQIGDREIQFDVDEPWPFRGTATQSFSLDDQRLTLSMRFTAFDRQPVSLGFHPWFDRRLEGVPAVELQFEPGAMYELDDEGMPSGNLVDPPAGPWDDCFTSVSSDPTLAWGGLEVKLSSTATHWVVYSRPDHAICVEPQTGPPNDVNDNPTILDPGESLSVTLTLEWSGGLAPVP
jgi:aldose 1-epimerase